MSERQPEPADPVLTALGDPAPPADGDDPAGDAMVSGDLQDRAVRGAAWTLLHTVLSVPVAFVVNLVLARVLAPDGYGRLAYLTLLIGLAGQVLALGLTSALVQFGAKAHAAGRRTEVQRMLSAAQGFRLLVVAPALTVIVLVAVDVPALLMIVAVVFGIWVPAALDGAVTAMYIENKTATAAKVALATNLITQTAVLGSLVWLGTADSVWAARTMVTAAVIALAMPVISGMYRRAIVRPRLPRGLPAGFWAFALPTGAAAIVAELVTSRSEVIVLKAFSDDLTVGLFALAYGVSSHIFAPAHALTGPLLPAVSGLREVDGSRVVAAFDRALRSSATAIGLMTAVALAPLVVLVPVLYGPDFGAAAPAVLALGITGAFGVLTGPVTAFVLARLAGRTLLRANVLALVLDLGVAVLLIPVLGLWGAVIANSAGTIAQLGILLRSERTTLGQSWSHIAQLVSPLLVGAAAAVLGAGAAAVVPWPPLGRAVLAGLIGAGVLTAGIRLVRSGLDPSDRDAILGVVPQAVRPAGTAILALVTHAPVR